MLQTLFDRRIAPLVVTGGLTPTARLLLHFVRMVDQAFGRIGTAIEQNVFDQFEQLSRAAQSAGVEIEMLEIEDDHYLSDSAEEARFLKALLAFLETHNPAD